MIKIITTSVPEKFAQPQLRENTKFSKILRGK